MKQLSILFLIIAASLQSLAQSTVPLRGDTVRIYKQGGNSELIIENSTRGRTGAFLRNKFNGRTEYAFAIDTVYGNATGDSLFFERGDSILSFKVTPNATGDKWNVLYADQLWRPRDRVDTSVANKAVITWTPHSTPLQSGSIWVNFTYSPELRRMVAVGHSSSGLDAMYSDNGGITWTSAVTPAQDWRGIAWSPKLGLFAAVGSTGTLNNAMTSPDGITWTSRTTPNSYYYRDIVWVEELEMFVAVANTAGVTDKVMTSVDGINWIAQTCPDRAWSDIVWSAELQKFLVSATSAVVGEKIMSSPDGINWTLHSMGDGDVGSWEGLTWSQDLEMFVAVNFTGLVDPNKRFATSPDGITWTMVDGPIAAWLSVAWSPTYRKFVAVGNSNAMATSSDGITWTSTSAPVTQNWRRIYWVKELGAFGVIAYTFSTTATTENLFITSRPSDPNQLYINSYGRNGKQRVLGELSSETFKSYPQLNRVPGAYAFGRPSSFEFVHTGNNYGLAVTRSSADAGGPNITFYKTRNANATKRFPAFANDFVGNLFYLTISGDSTIRESALQAVFIDTAYSTYNSTRFSWHTTNSTGTMSERMQLNSAGHLRLHYSNPPAGDSSTLVPTTAWVMRNRGTSGGGGSSYTFQHSISEIGGTVNLVGDVASPGNTYYYGTDAAGTKGFYALSGIGGYTLPALTSGSVIYYNGSDLAQNNSNFFWDNPNTRLGIGTNAPAHRLHVYQNNTETNLAGALFENAGLGDAQIGFKRGASVNVRVGIDQSDDRFKMSFSNTLGTTNFFTAASDGSIAFGTASPIAKMTIPPGSGAAFGAPLAIGGTAALMPTPQPGRFEYPDELYFTNSAGERHKISGTRLHATYGMESNITFSGAGTATGITFDTEYSELGITHSTSSNTDQITFPTAGVYSFAANFAATSSLAGDIIRFGLQKWNGASWDNVNGSAVKATIETASAEVPVTLNFTVTAAAGDIFRIAASASTVNIFLVNSSATGGLANNPSARVVITKL